MRTLQEEFDDCLESTPCNECETPTVYTDKHFFYSGAKFGLTFLREAIEDKILDTYVLKAYLDEIKEVLGG